MQTRDGKTIGINNNSGYSNPAIDALINKASVETDPVKRLVPIREAAILHRDDVGHIPLHTQYVVWATRSNIEPAISGNNYIQLRLIRVN